MLAAVKVGALALTLVGATLAGPALAQEVSSDSSSQTTQNQGRFQGMIMDTILEFLDVSQGEVISNWATGATLAEFALENGSSGQALVDKLMSVINERIDQALADGVIDEEKAEKLRSDAEDRINHLVFDARNNPGKPGLGGEYRQELIDAIENELGLNQGQVVSHVRTGGTLAELAEDNGSSGEELVEVLLAIVDDKVQDALDQGIIDEERAAEILENAEERLTHVVFDVHEPGQGRP